MSLQNTLENMIKSIHDFTEFYSFGKADEFIADIKTEYGIKTKHAHFLDSIQKLFINLDKLRIPEADSTPIKNLFDKSALEESDEEINHLCQMFSIIYASGRSIKDYSKVLLYLLSLSYPDQSSKKEVLDNWAAPYIEDLLVLLDAMEKEKDFKKSNQEYLKN